MLSSRRLHCSTSGDDFSSGTACRHKITPPTITTTRDELLAVLKQRHRPGTSKWKKVEHRLFSRITHSLRGQPLTDYEVLLRSISATRTRTGLTVKATLDENDYPTGRTLTKTERQAVAHRVEREEFHGEWNYAIAPRDPDTEAPTEPTRQPPTIPAESTFLLTHPALTGMTRERFDRLVDELEPCRKLLAEAERQRRQGIDRRGYNPGFGFLDHRHRVLAAILSCRNTVTLTLVARLLRRDRNTLSYHAHRTRPLLAFAGPNTAAVLAPPRRTHPPRTIEALKAAIEHYENMIKAGSS
ncbi:hypothetical protein ALI22I_01645 [Saccharothrix sp. ALI-22-I]|nr:hypothetical protein ALI22I_01645 [Saccharothrix sp. ALI-22-I]